MSRKIIFLINPISGTRQKNLLPSLLSDLTRKRGIHHEILPTVASGDYTFLKNKIEEESITDVVICGGDGTVNAVVAPLAKTGGFFCRKADSIDKGPAIRFFSAISRLGSSACDA